MTQPPSAPPGPPAGTTYPTSGYAVPATAYPTGYPAPGFPTYVPAPSPLSPSGQPLASFADRLLAYLVDVAIFYLVGIVLAVPALIIFFAVVGPDLFEVAPDGTPVMSDFFADFFVPLLVMEGILVLISFVLSYIYCVEMMFRSGQTYGKKVMKIKVVPLDPAATLSRGFAAKRFLVQHVAAGLVLGLSLLDGLWQLWDKPYQQCLHDKFAKTVVVKVPGWAP